MGKGSTKIFQTLISTLRDLLIEKEKTLYLMPLGQQSMSKSYPNKYANDRFIFYLDILNGTQNDIKWSNQKRAYLELANC